MTEREKYKRKCELEFPCFSAELEDKTKQSIFDLAWELGHSNGLNEVLSIYSDLIDLLEIIIKDVRFIS